MHSDARVRWKSQRQSLPEFWFQLDLGGMLILDSGILLALSLSCGYNFWSLRSRTALYSCKGRNRWQSAHELMSSQAKEISASKKMCKFVSSGCSSYFSFNATLVAVVFSCHVGLSSHLDNNQDYFTDFWKKEKKTIQAKFRLNAVWS